MAARRHFNYVGLKSPKKSRCIRKANTASSIYTKEVLFFFPQTFCCLFIIFKNKLHVFLQLFFLNDSPAFPIAFDSEAQSNTDFILISQSSVFLPSLSNLFILYLSFCFAFWINHVNAALDCTVNLKVFLFLTISFIHTLFPYTFSQSFPSCNDKWTAFI